MIYSQIWRYPIFRQILRETTLRFADGSKPPNRPVRRSAVTSASHAILNMSTSFENVKFSSCHVHFWSFSEGNHGKPIQEKNWLLELLPAGSWWAPRQGYNSNRKTWWILVVQNLPQIFHKTWRDTFCFFLFSVFVSVPILTIWFHMAGGHCHVQRPHLRRTIQNRGADCRPVQKTGYKVMEVKNHLGVSWKPTIWNLKPPNPDRNDPTNEVRTRPSNQKCPPKCTSFAK